MGDPPLRLLNRIVNWEQVFASVRTPKRVLLPDHILIAGKGSVPGGSSKRLDEAPTLIPGHLLSKLRKIGRESTRNMLSQLYFTILVNPGLHFRELQRRMDMGTGHLIYHVTRLLSLGFIHKSNDGRYLRYYASDSMDAEEVRVIELARKKNMPRVLSAFMRRRVMTHGELAEEMDMPPSTTSWYLKRLLEEGIAEKLSRGRKTFYYLKHPSYVKDVLKKNGIIT